jgi:hypothetical protein
MILSKQNMITTRISCTNFQNITLGCVVMFCLRVDSCFGWELTHVLFVSWLMFCLRVDSCFTWELTGFVWKLTHVLMFWELTNWIWFESIWFILVPSILLVLVIIAVIAVILCKPRSVFKLKLNRHVKEFNRKKYDKIAKHCSKKLEWYDTNTGTLSANISKINGCSHRLVIHIFQNKYPKRSLDGINFTT